MFANCGQTQNHLQLSDTLESFVSKVTFERNLARVSWKLSQFLFFWYRVRVSLLWLVKAKLHYAIGLLLANQLASWSQTRCEPVCDPVSAISTCRDSSNLVADQFAAGLFHYTMLVADRSEDGCLLLRRTLTLSPNPSPMPRPHPNPTYPNPMLVNSL